tara:strand:+ start:325 stop:624 length:300 start_codon:yes stop_codon:yes gene_type:complete
MKKAIVIKVILSILLVVCVFDMPYGFYQLVRFIALVGFGILAFNANQENKKTELIIYVSLALLFQPFMKISLGRDLWNIIDVIIAVALVSSVFVKNKHA